MAPSFRDHRSFPRRPRAVGVLLLLTMPVACWTQAGAATFKIGTVEAKLFYETSGSLSANILPPAHFEGHNTIIAEGDAKEPANDLLVVVGLTASTDEANSDKPLIIKVSAGGKVVAQRSFKDLLFKKGRVHKSLLVPDAACLNAVTVEASFEGQKKTSKVTLACGE